MVAQSVGLSVWWSRPLRLRRTFLVEHRRGLNFTAMYIWSDLIHYIWSSSSDVHMREAHPKYCEGGAKERREEQGVCLSNFAASGNGVQCGVLKDAQEDFHRSYAR